MLFAQITDCHVQAPGQRFKGRHDSAAMLARCVAALAALDPRPALVIATGDLVDHGSTAEYAQLKSVLAALPIPLALLPGNHDTRSGLRDAFPDAGPPEGWPQDGPLDWERSLGPLRLIGLDSTVPGEPWGRLGSERLARLDARLAAGPDQPTVVALHHPPAAVGIVHMDEMGLADGPDLAAVIARHPQVERVICGHLHRTIDLRWAGTTLSVAPSTAHQLALDLTPEGRTAAFTHEPPGFRLFQWLPASGLVGHTVPVGDFPGPFAYG